MAAAGSTRRRDPGGTACAAGRRSDGGRWSACAGCGIRNRRRRRRHCGRWTWPVGSQSESHDQAIRQHGRSGLRQAVGTMGRCRRAAGGRAGLYEARVRGPQKTLRGAQVGPCGAGTTIERVPRRRSSRHECLEQQRNECEAGGVAVPASLHGARHATDATARGQCRCQRPERTPLRSARYWNGSGAARSPRRSRFQVDVQNP